MPSAFNHIRQHIHRFPGLGWDIFGGVIILPITDMGGETCMVSLTAKKTDSCREVGRGVLGERRGREEPNNIHLTHWPRKQCGE